MADIRLARLPDRTPIKLAVAILPELNEALLAYARFYKLTYGRDEKVVDLIPFMLSAYVESDRGFSAFRRTKGEG